MLEQYLEINSKNFLTVIKLLQSSGGQARLVGGVVRDTLMGVPGSDVDIATDLTPDQVTKLLSSHNIKVIPTGIRFGTVTAILKGESFEITTLRRDLDCDGRHASVAYSLDFAEDAARRDFTINALSYCPITHVIYDYFGGIEDLKAGKVVFIGDAKQRIREDYLRILRFFRFSCRYAKSIDAKGLAACIANKDKLVKLSKERIKAELDSLLLLPKSPEMLFAMFDSGILEQILPIKKYDKYLHIRALDIAGSFGVELELPVIYSMMFTHVDDISLNKLLELKFSRAEARLIIKILELKNIDDTIMIATRLKSIWLEERMYVWYFIYASLIFSDNAFIQKLYNKLNKLRLPSFPVSGKDLLVLGYSGQEMGKMLDLMQKKWIESEFTLDRLELINLIKNSEK